MLQGYVFRTSFRLVRSRSSWLCGHDGEWPVDDPGRDCGNGGRRDERGDSGRERSRFTTTARVPSSS